MVTRLQRRDRRTPWQFVALSVAMLLVACGTPVAEQVATHVRTADRLAAAGDNEAAVDELRAAIALQPDDPGLHRRRGQLLLATGDGALAAVDFRTAISLGAGPADVAPDLAEALLLQGKPLEARDLLPAGDAAPADPVLRARVAGLRARSLLALRNAPDADVQAALREVFDLLDATPGADAERRRFTALRASSAVVELAWQHHACRTATPAAYAAGPPPGADVAAAAGGRVLRVGPGQPLRSPAAAARVARDGDTVLVDAGTYPDGSALWPQHRLTILGGAGGPPGARSRVLASARGIEDRDAWLFTGDDVRVENVEISGARAARSRNGAAIRHMGRNLTLRNVYLHDNDDGLLTGDRAPDGRVLIEFSEFARNGHGDGLSHNIYVGRAGELTLRYSWSREARSGQLVKSRAFRNRIVANRLTDGVDGNGSYLIDLSEGGDALIAGNVLQKSHSAENPVFITFAAEGTPHANNVLTVVHNTVWNSRYKATVVRNGSTAVALVANNIMAGAPVLALEGPGNLVTNLRRAETGLTDPRALDFSLQPGSAAIDAGTPLAVLGAAIPQPLAEYVHPLAGRDRLGVGPPDLGAYEYCDGPVYHLKGDR